MLTSKKIVLKRRTAKTNLGSTKFKTHLQIV